MSSCAGCVIDIEPADPPRVSVSGEINYESAPHISRALEQLQQAGRRNVTLDCSGVDFVDSSGIGVIVHAAQSLKGLGGGLRLSAATQQLVHALQVSGFIGLLDLDDGVLLNEPARVKPTIDGSSWHQASFSIPVHADMDGTIRRRVTEFAKSMAFTAEEIEDIRLAAGEAVSNAVRHGCKDKVNDRLKVRCSGDSQKLTVRITNPGDPFDPNVIPIPNPTDLREGGMGIFFMRSSMDDVSYIFDDDGTTVILTKYLRTDNSDGN